MGNPGAVNLLNVPGVPNVRMGEMMRLATVLIVALTGLSAGEIVLLHSGLQLRVDRLERTGSRIRLYSAAGTTEIAAAEVVEVEHVADAVTALPDAPESAAPPVLPPARSPRDLVELAAIKHGLPPEFVRLVAGAESAFNPKALSPKGAIGLMQLMPGTAAQLKVDPHDPAQNAEGGVRLLKELLIRYQEHPDQLRRALAAYNAGEGAVTRYGGVPPYRETQNYVHKIVEQYKRIAPASE